MSSKPGQSLLELEIENESHLLVVEAMELDTYHIFSAGGRGQSIVFSYMRYSDFSSSNFCFACNQRPLMNPDLFSVFPSSHKIPTAEPKSS